MAAVLNSSSADASTRSFRLAGNSNYGSGGRHHRRKKQRRRGASSGGGGGQGPKPTAEVFATILLCSSADDSRPSDPTKNKYARGMTMFRHIHSKISQDVCNAIFLCKVVTLTGLKG